MFNLYLFSQVCNAIHFEINVKPLLTPHSLSTNCKINLFIVVNNACNALITCGSNPRTYHHSHKKMPMSKTCG